MLLRIGGLQALLLRDDPDLKEMNRIVLRGIELGTANTGSRRHKLDVARADHRAAAKGIAVRQPALEDIRKDLHVLMAVGIETAAPCHPVIIDDPERAEAHMARIVILAKRKAVMAVEPAKIGMAAFGRLAMNDHLFLLVR